MNKRTLKGIVTMLVIVLMLSISTMSFGQVLPEGYPPTQEDLDNQTVTDQIQQTIEYNATDTDLVGCIYDKLIDYSWYLTFTHNTDWSMRYHTYTFPDGSK